MADDWAGKRQQGRLGFHPCGWSASFSDKRSEHSNIGERFQKKQKKQRRNLETKGFASRAPSGFTLSLFCVCECVFE